MVRRWQQGANTLRHSPSGLALASALSVCAGCGSDNGAPSPADAAPASDSAHPSSDGSVTTGDAQGGVDSGADASADAAAPSDAAADAPLDGGGDGSVAPIQPSGTGFLDPGTLLGNLPDPGWYVDNIPFFEAPDPQIQAIYYYRWESYKEHLGYTGAVYGYMTTEFLFPSSYGAPYGGINAAAGHHIAEGKWLRTERYAKDVIRYWLGGPGQFQKQKVDAVNADTSDWAHEYSFWVASSVWLQYLTTGDQAFAASWEPALINQYTGWANHFNAALGLYWQVPVWDATEYSAASYQSPDPYHGGAGYRPSINGFQYGDARAIANIAKLTGDAPTAATYDGLADALRTNMQKYLWDSTRNFFYDMPRDNNPGLTLLNTREEMGFIPWMFDMPQASDAVAFKQLLDPMGFAAMYGPTTAERRSTWFMYQAASGCCRWDGPSWPYETAQTLRGLANVLLDGPAQSFVTNADYVNLLHTYAATQFENGSPHLGQAHDPDNNNWMYEGDDYNHSTFNDNVISELVGLRGQPDDTLVVSPLAPATWDYFALENALYHGHQITVLWDRTGARYGQGAGMHVYVDGAQAVSQATLAAAKVNVGPAVVQSERLEGVDVAANGQKYSYLAQPFASYTWNTDSVWNAVDGFIFRVGIPEGTRWTSYSSPNPSDYLGVNFQRSVTLDYVRLYFYDDGGGVRVPSSYDLQYFANNTWTSIPAQTSTPATAAPNAPTEIHFPPVTTTQIRVVAPNAGGNVGWGLSELWARSKPIFHFVNVNSNLLLAVQNAAQNDGAQVQQYHDSGTPDHLWELVDAGAGLYKIVNVNSGLLLAPAGGSMAVNGLVQQTVDSASPFVLWRLVDDVFSGYVGKFKVRNEGSHLLLGVDGDSSADSANIVQVADNGSPNHLWTVQPADEPQLSLDDFEDQSTSQWTPLSGTWGLCAPATTEYCATTTALSLSLTGQTGWRNYSVEASVRPNTAGLGTDLGVVARAQDAANYYFAELTRDAHGILGWAISKDVAGVTTRLAAGSHAWGVGSSGQIVLRFGVQGGYLSLGIVTPSGAVHTLGSVFDTTFPSGQAGVRASGVVSSFDNVRVMGG